MRCYNLGHLPDPAFPAADPSQIPLDDRLLGSGIQPIPRRVKRDSCNPRRAPIYTMTRDPALAGIRGRSEMGHGDDHLGMERPGVYYMEVGIILRDQKESVPS